MARRAPRNCDAETVASQGGANLPNLKLYNMACLLRHAVDWSNMTCTYSNYNLESAQAATSEPNSTVTFPNDTNTTGDQKKCVIPGHYVDMAGDQETAGTSNNNVKASTDDEQSQFPTSKTTPGFCALGQKRPCDISPTFPYFLSPQNLCGIKCRIPDPRSTAHTLLYQVTAHWKSHHNLPGERFAA